MDLKELESRFVYHPPKDDQPEKYRKLREGGFILAQLICVLVPESREQSIALTHLEECIMQANAGIARRS
jgi:hypothetical protein